MRILASAALALLLLATLPAHASADVTVHEPLPSGCRGTYGANAGPYAEAWVGSGHPTAAGPCYLHVFVATPPLAEDDATVQECSELEWDTGYTHYVCWLGGQPECALVAVGEEDPGRNRKNWVCFY